MGARTHIARFAAWTLLPVLLLTEAVPGWTSYFCRHAEETLAKPCCADEESVAKDEEPAPAPLAITEAACCTAIRDDFERPTSEPFSTASVLPPALVAALSELVVPETAPRAPVEASVLPVASGPPIRLKIQSFLN